MCEDKNVNLSSTGKFLLMCACFVITVAGMKTAEVILVPFLLSLFIAVVVSPLMFWLVKIKVPTSLAILILSLILVLVGILVASLVGSTLANFSSSLPQLQEQLQVKIDTTIAWLDSHHITVDANMVKEYINIGAIMNVISKLISQLTGLLADGFLIFLTVVFLLLEASSLPYKLKYALGLSPHAVEEVNRFGDSVKRYLGIKTITSLITASLVLGLLLIQGVKYSLLWALLAFCLNYVPNIGSFIAALPAIAISLVQLGFHSSIVTAIGYIIINVLIGNVVEPRWMGRGLGLSTLVVFLSLVFWGWLFGPIGMLLSVPLTMVVKVLLENHSETRHLAMLLSSENGLREQ